MAAGPSKSISMTSGDGLAATFVQYTVQIPGANTIPFTIQGAVQGVSVNPQTGGGGVLNMPGSVYQFATAALGTIGPSAVTMWANIQVQPVGGSVSLVTSTVAYPTIVTGFVEVFRMQTNGETNPAAATILQVVPTW